MMGFNWDSRAVAAAPIPLDKLPLIENAVTNQCDASDGLLDGLVQDPRACSFEPAVLRCQGAETKDCLTGAQIEAVREVYGGPANSSGRRVTPGFPSGAESNGGWDVWISGGAITDPASRQMFETGLILNAIDPDLRRLERRGSKIVMYHGWTDHALSALKTIQYYEQVGRTMGGPEEVRDFFRFFLVPDMHHCGGGPGPNVFDAFSALVDWVEQGKAPSASSPRGARWWPHAPALSARTRSKPSTRARATSTTQRTSSARRRSRPTTTEVQGVVAVRTE